MSSFFSTIISVPLDQRTSASPFQVRAVSADHIATLVSSIQRPGFDTTFGHATAFQNTSQAAHALKSAGNGPVENTPAVSSLSDLSAATLDGFIRL